MTRRSRVVRNDPRGERGASRRRAREVALQVLYAIDMGTDRPRFLAGGRAARSRAAEEVAAPDAGEPTPVSVFEAVAAHFEVPPGVGTFAREIVESVRRHGEEIDRAITAHALNWRMSRMAAVDRNILRLATWELAYTDTPVAVVLDEAIDLARRFGDDPSPAFVNGILDAIARDARSLGA